jgi:dipeptidyl aminopeptidase/acylaminoacyl peptidase
VKNKGFPTYFSRIVVPLVLALTPAVSTASEAILRHGALSLSSDGGRMLDVEFKDFGSFKSPQHAVVIVRRADGEIEARYDPCSTCAYSDTAWGADDHEFAFVGSSHGIATLYRVAKGKLRSATKIQGEINTPRFSSDSTRIAMLVTRSPRKASGAASVSVSLTGQVGVNPDEQRLEILNSRDEFSHPVSPPDRYIYEYDWMPDGSGCVVVDAPGDGDANWWTATVDVLNISSGSMRRIGAPGFQIARPRVSLDGKWLALVGGLMSDRDGVGGDIYVLPMSGGALRNVSRDFPGSFDGVVWRGDHLLGTALSDDRAAIVELDSHSVAFRTLWSARVGARTQESEGKFIFGRDGSVAASISDDFTHGPELMRGPIPSIVPVTNDNAGLPANLAAQSMHWQSDGLRIQGWLLMPARSVGPKKHPMLVIAHGGPASAVTPHYIATPGYGTGFDSSFLVDLIRRGYYVFYPNDRGSFGAGERFTRANVKDFGGGDMRDLLRGIDAVEKIGTVDDRRLALYGQSYGGWFAMWANTHTRRFKAMIAGAGISNWTSYYGENGIDGWMMPYFGASLYDDPNAYRRVSPIEFIREAHTPTLLFVGVGDLECPPSQSLEYWHALRALGVQTELYVYPEEGHSFRSGSDLSDLRARIVSWLDKLI